MDTLPNADNAREARSSEQLLRTANARLEAISTLVSDLDRVPLPPPPPPAALQFENKLVQVRLGIASSLFQALRAKHHPSASHSLRVAMGCSAWGVLLGLNETERDELEVAGLLHDIGKIGIPDSILLKPGRLTAEELRVLEQHRSLGLEILRGCSASQNVLDIVSFAGSWYDGSRGNNERRGNELPIGARMVSLIDAFDSMTADQVYRRAMSRERALAELFDFAGSQFDPHLTREFCNYLNADQNKLMESVCRRWLKELNASASTSLWKLGEVASAASTSGVETVFQEQLLEHMHDAVIFVDITRKILLWNRAAERLTGMSLASVEHKTWEPSLIALRDDRGAPLQETDCPVLQSIASGIQTFRRMQLAGRGQHLLSVDAHVIPVAGESGTIHGATLMLRDASSQISLEKRVTSLHERATRDPLTGAANRAEFDSTLRQMVDSHQEQNLPCALVICDIDHFKKVNDTYGHQAGDQVLVAFAAILQRHCRVGDLVARYGGEEFVMLCSDCDNNTATRRAERLRLDIASFPQSALGGSCLTASFGVTELQAGDSPETMLNRADRALYQAKENGRNAVVQLGSGNSDHAGDKRSKSASWFSWFTKSGPPEKLERKLAASVPIGIAAEKIKGFVCDQKAEIVSIDAQHVVLSIEGENLPQRRTGDRSVTFLVELRLSEKQGVFEGYQEAVLRTIVQVVIQPRNSRDRRRQETAERAQQILASLKSYLLADEILSEANDKPA